jgi:hypothetical protein
MRTLRGLASSRKAQLGEGNRRARSNAHAVVCEAFAAPLIHGRPFGSRQKGTVSCSQEFPTRIDGLNITRPQRIEIDEWIVDLMTIMESSGLAALLTPEELQPWLDKKVGRWCSTVAIDVATRM